MPRKTKEQKELENEEKTEKKLSITQKISEAVKKVTSKSKTTKPTEETNLKTDVKEINSKTAAPKSTSKKATSKVTSTKTAATKSSSKTASSKSATKKATTKSTAKKAEPKAATKKTSTKKTSTTSTSKKTSKTVGSSKGTKKSATKKTLLKEPTKKSAIQKTTLKRVNTSNKKVQIVEYYDLPYRYNQTVVKVLAQTPTNLFIYWDVSDKDRENFENQYGKNFFETTKPVLIVYNTTLNYKFEIEINDFANSWYLHVADSKCDYKIELGRRPITKTEKINVDYIYIATSNQIESPNNRILFDRNQKMIYFKNIKTGQQTEKPINSLSFIQNMGKIYNIYDMYKAIYQDENIEKIYDLSNPSSGNPSSGSLSSKFK